MNLTIGIDFGTTKTLVSWIDAKNDQAKLVRLGRGIDKIPTTVYINEDGIFLFGEDADDKMLFDSGRYARDFKLKLGTDIPVVSTKINGQKQCFSARELTSKFLEYIKNRCEQEVYLGEKVSGAVITVPVAFSPAQKIDLEKAAKDAGYSEVTLLPEPEAAGFAFAQYNPAAKFKNMMIVDWGGGTVDCAIVSQNADGGVRCSSCFGDDQCGGVVFDDLLFEFAASKIVREDLKQRNPLNEPLEFRGVMRKRSCLCKEQLSKSSESRFAFAGEKGPYSAVIRRNEFEGLISGKIDGVAQRLQQYLQKISQSGSSLPEALLLVGGSSYIPVIQEKLKRQSGLKTVSWQYANEAVALGAALYASKKSDAQSGKRSADSKMFKCPVCYQKLRCTLGQINFGQSKLHCPECSAVFVITEKVVPSLEELVETPSKLFDIKKLAAEGNSTAESLLGILYSDGLIADLDYEAGYRYSKKAADAGDFFASFYLAVDLYDGRGVHQNTRKANEIFSKIYNPMFKGAQKGNPLAQYALGYMYSRGIVVAEDDEIAYRWYAESAKKNNLQAMQALSDCYFRGCGVAKNKQLAYKFVKMAAEKGLYPAYCDLAYHYEWGIGVDEDSENAIYYARKAVDHGVYAAAYIVYDQYLEKNEPEKANAYFKPCFDAMIRDAENGNRDAQTQLGYHYTYGRGVEQSERKAFDWFKKAADQKDPEAMQETALCYLYGTGTAVNQYVAFKILNSKELKNDSDAVYELWHCYYNGWGTNPNEKEAMRHLKQAAYDGCEDAIFDLGRMYLDGRVKNECEAVRQFSRIANTNGKANYWLGICYRDGRGVRKSAQDAVKYFLIAAVDYDDADAMVALAECYRSGSGVKSDEKTAFELFSRAAELGSKDAVYYLFTLYGICYSENEERLVRSMQQIISRVAAHNSNLYPENRIPDNKNIIAKYVHGDPCCLALYDASLFGFGNDGFLISYEGIWWCDSAEDKLIGFQWKDIKDVYFYGSGNISVNDNVIHLKNKAQKLMQKMKDVVGDKNTHMKEEARQLAQMILDLKALFINHFPQ